MFNGDNNKNLIRDKFEELLFESNKNNQVKIFSDYLQKVATVGPRLNVRMCKFIYGMVNLLEGVIYIAKGDKKTAHLKNDTAVKLFGNSYSSLYHPEMDSDIFYDENRDFLDTYINIGLGKAYLDKAEYMDKNITAIEDNLSTAKKYFAKNEVASDFEKAWTKYFLGRLYYNIAGFEYKKRRLQNATEWESLSGADLEKGLKNLASVLREIEKKEKQFTQDDKLNYNTLVDLFLNDEEKNHERLMVEKNYLQAVAYFSEANDVYNQIRNGKQLLCAINGQGDTYNKLGKLATEKSGDYYNSAKKCYEAILDSGKEEINNWCDANTKANVELAKITKHLQDCRIKLHAINGLGNYYREMGNYNYAVKLYELIKEVDSQFIYPYVYLGDCYRILSDYQKAVENYTRAGELQPNSVFALYGLGRVCYELGKISDSTRYYNLAMDFFNRVRNVDPYFPYVYLDLARVLTRKNRLGENKLAVYYEVLQYYGIAWNKFRNVFRRECIKTSFLDVFNRVNYLLAAQTKQEKIMAGLLKEGIDEQVFVNKKSFDDFLTPHNPQDQYSNPTIMLEVFKRWNSYTPLLTGGKGGGYFVKAYDRGLVIDPGHNFIDNFILAGHKFYEINDVLITHSHDDHTADVEAIINLLYRYNKDLREAHIPSMAAKATNMSRQTINDMFTESAGNNLTEIRPEIIAQYCEDGQNNPGKKLHFYLSAQSKAKFDPLFSISADCESQNVSCFAAADDSKLEPFIIDKAGQIKVYAVKASHKDLNYDNSEAVSPLGFIIDLEAINVILVFTSDTGWNSTIEKQYEKLLANQQWQTREVFLIAHIGGFQDNEWNDNYYKNHLGRLGLVKILETLTPKYCIISEFGEEFRYLRTKLTKVFQRTFSDITFLPADIGLKIAFNKRNIKIEAITEIDLYGKTIKYSMVDIDKVDFNEIPSKDSIYYYIKNKENEKGAKLKSYNNTGDFANYCTHALLNNFQAIKANIEVVTYEKMSKIYKDLVASSGPGE